MLPLAALNRSRLTPRLAAGGSARPLARTTAAEILLGVAVLALASGFRLTPPPRILAAAAAAQPAYVHLHGTRVMADVTIRPGRPGANTAEIVVYGTDPGPTPPAGVTLALSLPAQGIEPLRLAATAEAEAWHTAPFVLPAAATWTATLSVRIDAFTQETLEGELTLGP